MNLKNVLPFVSLCILLLIAFFPEKAGAGYYGWGSALDGALGQGSTEPEKAYSPIESTALERSGIVPIQIVSSGDYGLHEYTCALAARLVWCWGSNPYGQAGAGNFGSSFSAQLTPIVIRKAESGNPPLKDVRKIALASSTGCALTYDDHVWCWGLAGGGQLGIGPTSMSYSPHAFRVNLSNVRDISAGSDHFCAIVDGDGVYCWGWNYYGQIGDGTTNTAWSPKRVSSLPSDVVKVALGGTTSYALTRSGDVYSWGDNSYCQIGNGERDLDGTNPVLTPVHVASGIADIQAGGYFVFARTKDGRILVWGRDISGVLGGSSTTVCSPSEFTLMSPSQISRLILGYGHACAIRPDRTIYCWGDNSNGQLGRGASSSGSDFLTGLQTAFSPGDDFGDDFIPGDGGGDTTPSTSTPEPVLYLSNVTIGDSSPTASHLVVQASYSNPSEPPKVTAPSTISFQGPSFRPVLLPNTGATITSITAEPSDVFQVDPGNCIGSSSDCYFSVVFNPPDAEGYNGTVMITYDDGSGPKTEEINVSANFERKKPLLPCFDNFGENFLAEGDSSEGPKAFFVVLRKGRCRKPSWRERLSTSLPWQAGDCLKKIRINNPNTAELTGYQVRVSSSALAASNFVIEDTKGRTVPYCYEQPNGECSENPTDTIWVRVESIPAGGSVILCARPAASNGASPPDQVFDRYSDFSGKFPDRYSASSISSGIACFNDSQERYWEFTNLGRSPLLLEMKASPAQESETDLSIEVNGQSMIENWGRLSISAGTYDTARLIVKPKEQLFYFEWWYRSSILNTDSITSLKFRDSDLTNTYGICVDWIRIRKYADEEPVSVVTD